VALGLNGGWGTGIDCLLLVFATADAYGWMFVSKKSRADQATSRLHCLDGVGHAWACIWDARNGYSGQGIMNMSDR
jgi:hypothetical protein